MESLKEDLACRDSVFNGLKYKEHTKILLNLKQLLYIVRKKQVKANGAKLWKQFSDRNFSVTSADKITSSDQFCINRHHLVCEEHLQLSFLSYLLQFDNNIREQMFWEGFGKQWKTN